MASQWIMKIILNHFKVEELHNVAFEQALVEQFHIPVGQKGQKKGFWDE